MVPARTERAVLALARAARLTRSHSHRAAALARHRTRPARRGRRTSARARAALGVDVVSASRTPRRTSARETRFSRARRSATRFIAKASGARCSHRPVTPLSGSSDGGGGGGGGDGDGHGDSCGGVAVAARTRASPRRQRRRCRAPARATTAWAHAWEASACVRRTPVRSDAKMAGDFMRAASGTRARSSCCPCSGRDFSRTAMTLMPTAMSPQP